jgi:DNA replication and repair protein RecF
VWDAKLATTGTELGDARASLVARLQPDVVAAYEALAGGPAGVTLDYASSWRPPVGAGLAEALAAARADDVRRGVSTIGPHRDDVSFCIGELPARTHASQGEQRTLALALRLGGHAVVTASAGSTPVLLLDDVFSELDPGRTDALVAHLPPGQALLTTAGPPPAGMTPAALLRIEAGRLLASG